MANFEEKKFIDRDGLIAFYNKHQEQIDEQIDLVVDTFDEHVAQSNTKFTEIDNALNEYILKPSSEGGHIATMTDINEIITDANNDYTETALNIALDELNGEVV